jgi:hypothetical protein
LGSALADSIERWNRSNRNPFTHAEASASAPWARNQPIEVTSSGTREDVAPGAKLALEVAVYWGNTVLQVEHLSPARSFYIGSETTKQAPLDFVLPEGAQDMGRCALVSVEGGEVRLALPGCATGTVERGEEPPKSIDALRDELGNAASFGLELAPGMRATLELFGLSFRIGLVAAEDARAAAPKRKLDGTAIGYFAASVVGHACIIGSMAFFQPSLDGLEDDEGISPERLVLIQQYLRQSAEREQPKIEEERRAETTNDRGRPAGERSRGAEGKLGSQIAKAKNARYGVQGDKSNTDTFLSKRETLATARTFGMIGLLTGGSNAANVPTAPWGREAFSGNDPANALGNMWGDSIDDAFGSGGLGLTGLGEGSGGRGEGIGITNMGGLGDGTCVGAGCGFGPARLVRGTHVAKAPSPIRQGETIISGHLPPEVIQRIVRQNFGRFRLCYERGLAKNPNLEGRVAVRFVIDREGSVSNVANGGSDLPDSSVVSCVISAYYGITFPPPSNGIVRVVYPLMFSPSG